jgi:hypothetical protein
LSEIFPNHIRAKGVVVGVATICAINIVWLQVAPIAFETIGYRFYLTFCIPGFFAAAWLWFYFPNTLGMPLEDVAKIFGDHDELYSQTSAADAAGKEKAEVGIADMGSSHVEDA